jgi:hypothetical protein
VARRQDYRTVKDLIQHLPKLTTGSSFQRVIQSDKQTENKGYNGVDPNPEWIEWVDDLSQVRLAPEIYPIIEQIGRIRLRQGRELRWLHQDRKDLEEERETARQAHRQKLRLQEESEQAALQGIRRSGRGRIPLKRKQGE